jgi:hypothetical protein
MKPKSTVLSTLLVVALTAGASPAETVSASLQPAAVPPAGSPAVKSPAPPAAATVVKPASDSTAKKKPVERADNLSGKVLEVINGGGYTFFHLEKEGITFWVASSPTQAKVGEEVSFEPGIEMSNFNSKSLGRTFDLIYFSGGKVQPAGSATDPDFLKNKAHSMKPSAVAATEVKGAPAAPPITGKILEKLDGGGYSYFLLEKEGKKTWVAVSPTPGKVGDTVTFPAGIEMKAFPSKALNRTFDSIIFTDNVAPSAPKTMVSEGHSQGATTPADQSGKPLDVKVAKSDAANGYTVAELYGKSGELNGKEIVIQGRVVKVSRQIMGKNWVHLQDGTGDTALGSNNLVTTTQDSAVVGDLVVATGKLAKEKDFGGGYRYAVIIEETKLVKK